MKKVKELARRRWFLPIVASLATVILLLIVFIISGYAPFGGKSLVVADADIQYLDFFAYLKDVLAGQNDVFYTFSKTLGGNNIAVFSYYLASPLNLMVMFFDKADLTAFFDILVMVKISLAAFFATYYLKERFRNNFREFPRRLFFAPLLGVAYALSQYPLAQSNGVMWLDAVYLLPLVLLGVYRLINERRSTLFSILVAMAILFNWYTGAMVCIFAVGWFVFEYLLANREFKIKVFLKVAVRFVFAMGLGLLASCILFLPTIGALSSGNRSTLEFGRLKDLSLVGDIFPGIIMKYRPGAASAYGSVSLYCGAMTMIGVIGSLLSKKFTARKKWIFFGMLVATVLIFYWSPLVILFSLFKKVGSYWYRYSFVGIFVLVFLAAQFYFRRQSLRLKSFWLMVITAFVLLDAGLNTYLIYKGNSRENVASYHNYSENISTQVDALSEYDSGVFRVSQTSNRGNVSNSHALTAYYNEPLAYNFWSISGYTSSPDDMQRKFLDRVGYRINGENMCITNDPIIGADALLGVRYIWSAYPVNGLEPVPELGEYNGKSAYRNPYAAPSAFVVEGKIETVVDGKNPFEYQNMLYSQLIGREVEIYKPLDYKEEDGVYQIALPDGDFAIYGNLKWTSTFSDTIKVNGAYEQPYAQWKSPSVFYIPTDDDDVRAELVLSAEDVKKVSEVQFYALDLEELAAVSKKLQNTPEEMVIKNGYADFTVTAEEGQSLVTTIPVDRGWEVVVNGERVSPKLFGDTFYAFTLRSGKNEIKLVYHPPYLWLGVLVSCVGILGMVGVGVFERRGERK